MAKLQCEVCGGKLMGKPGGIFECEYCGMEYDTAWAKEKIQEIKGTVKVEGTVQVAGTVKVEGSISAEGLLKRVQLALEDGDWKSADEYCEKVLDIDPECAQAYLGKLMATLRVHKRDKLKDCAQPFDGDDNYQKVMRFGNEKLKAELQGYSSSINQRIEEYREKLRTIRFKVQLAQHLLATGAFCTIALKADGTVDYGSTEQGDVSDWRDVVAISAGSEHTVGLKADGTVVAVGRNGCGQCKVNGWKDIVAISADGYYTVGLKTDGTVVAVGSNEDGQCNVDSWTDIVAISAGFTHTVGLKSNGTVVATEYTGQRYDGQCDVFEWKDIVAISAGLCHTVGLRANGTVVAVGRNGCGQCNVSGWNDIVAISAGIEHTVGLKADGTVVAVGSNEGDMCNVSDWSDIVAIIAGNYQTAGLRADGTVVGGCWYDQCDNAERRLFENFENLESERTAARIARQKLDEEERIAQEKKAEEARVAREKKAEEERIAREKKAEEERIARDRRAAGLCQHCGGELKGFFSKKCISCGKSKDY